MSAHPATGIVAQECKDQHPHRMNLPFGTCIGGMTVAVKSALITNANTVLVVSFCVVSTGRVIIFISVKMEI